MALGTWTLQNSSSAFNVTIPADTGDRVGVLFVSFEYNTAPTVTATVGGVSMTSAGTAALTSVGGGTENTTYAFYILDADMPAAGTQSVAISVVGGSGSQGFTQAYATHTGRTQAAPQYARTTGGVVASLPIGPLNTANDSYGMAATSDGAGANTCTVGGSWTERWDQADVGGDAVSSGADITYAATSTDTVTFTPSAAARICGAFLVLATGAALVGDTLVQPVGTTNASGNPSTSGGSLTSDTAGRSRITATVDGTLLTTVRIIKKS